MPRSNKDEIGVYIDILGLRKTPVRTQGVNGVEGPKEIFVEPMLRGRDTDVSLKSAIERHSKTLILGPPGSGKTTLLGFLCLHYVELYEEQNLVPFYMPLRTFPENFQIQNGQMTLPNNLSSMLSSDFCVNISIDKIKDVLTLGNAILFFDGLDEIVNENTNELVVTYLEHVTSQFPKVKIVITSRTVSPPHRLMQYKIFRLSPFSDSQIDGYLQKTLLSQELIYGLRKAIFLHPEILQMCRNPLILTLIKTIYVKYKTLPANTTQLFDDIIDYSLSTWEERKNIHKELSLSERKHLLESIAFHIQKEDLSSISKSALVSLIKKELQARNKERKKPEEVLYELVLRTGVIREISRNRFAFIHHSFCGYLAARFIISKNINIEGYLNIPMWSEVITMLCGSMDDSSEILEKILHSKDILFIIKCFSVSKSVRDDVKKQVIDRFVDYVGYGFILTLSKMINDAGTKPTNKNNYWLKLRSEWSLCKDPCQTSKEKGDALEIFCKSFFGSVFRFARRNMYTELGELDLIFEITSNSPYLFWSDYGAELVVECKNWGIKRPLSDINNFATKVRQGRDKLGLIISMSGFTKGAIDMAKNLARDLTHPLIVPISGEEIDHVLLKQIDIEIFLKESIRRMKYAEK